MVLRKVILIFFCFLYPAFVVNAQDDITVKARLINKKIVVGDKIRFELLLEAPKEYQIALEDWVEENFKGLAVKDFGQEKKLLLRSAQHLWWFVFDTYVSGEYQLSGLSVRYKKRQEQDWKIQAIDPLTFNVESLLKDEDMDIKDIYGPVANNRVLFWLVLITSLSLFFSLLAWFMYREVNRAKVVEFFISPSEEAFKALDKLSQMELSDSQKIKAFFSDLSFIVRRYIERQFEVRAPEMTTEEFLSYAREGTFIGADVKKSLVQFFSLADMVKFAKYETDKEEAFRSLAAVKEFVEKTIPVKNEEDDL